MNTPGRITRVMRLGSCGVVCAVTRGRVVRRTRDHARLVGGEKTTTGAMSSGSIQGTPSGDEATRLCRAASLSAADPDGCLPVAASACA